MKMWRKKGKKRKEREKNVENEKYESKKLKSFPDELQTWNLDHSSEVDNDEWKYEKRRKKTIRRENDEENERDEKN